ncbi:MAG: hypothetical protein BWK75_03030 [Candidatus Altiarchaeales archaeon A3]|nr:MAG: hypothetical protein BWK75_03030 [Candidatus Altiarchaeales archaeon A3]
MENDESSILITSNLKKVEIKILEEDFKEMFKTANEWLLKKGKKTYSVISFLNLFNSKIVLFDPKIIDEGICARIGCDLKKTIESINLFNTAKMRYLIYQFDNVGIIKYESFFLKGLGSWKFFRYWLNECGLYKYIEKRKIDLKITPTGEIIPDYDYICKNCGKNFTEKLALENYYCCTDCKVKDAEGNESPVALLNKNYPEN